MARTTRRRFDLDNDDDLIQATYEQGLVVAAEQAKHEELKARVREQIGYTNNETRGLTVIVRPNKTWDKRLAREKYGDDICSLQVDQALAKAKLTGDEYDALYRVNHSKPVVTIQPTAPTED